MAGMHIFLNSWKCHMQCLLYGSEVNYEERVFQLKSFMVQFQELQFDVHCDRYHALPFISNFTKRLCGDIKQLVIVKDLIVQIYPFFMFCMLFATSKRCKLSSSLVASIETLTMTFSVLRNLLFRGLYFVENSNHFKVKFILRYSMTWVHHFCIEVIKKEMTGYYRDDLEHLLPPEYLKIFKYILIDIYETNHPIELKKGMLSAYRHNCLCWILLFERFDKALTEADFIDACNQTVCEVCRRSSDEWRTVRPFAILDSCHHLCCTSCLRDYLNASSGERSCPVCTKTFSVWGTNDLFILQKTVVYPRQAERDKKLNKYFESRMLGSVGSSFFPSTRSPTVCTQVKTSRAAPYTLLEKIAKLDSNKEGQPERAASSQTAASRKPTQSVADSSCDPSSSEVGSIYRVDSRGSSNLICSNDLSGNSGNCKAVDPTVSSSGHQEAPDSIPYSLWYNASKEILRTPFLKYIVCSTVGDVLFGPDFDVTHVEPSLQCDSNVDASDVNSIGADLEFIDSLFYQYHKN